MSDTLPPGSGQAAMAALAPLLNEKCILLAEHHAKALMARIAEATRAGKPEARVTIVGPSGTPDSFQRVGRGVASIPIVGVLTKYATWWDSCCGMIATQTLLLQLQEAMADPEVTAIALDIDSPGGFVNGTVEFADAVSAAGKIKPIVAVVRGMCCSGAYWIASQCSQIVSRREAEVGNIGVYSVLADVSKFYSTLGIDLTLVASGQFKGLGADGKVTDDLKADTARIVMGLYQQFTSAVLSGRGLDAESADGLFDGRCYLGPQALKLGLIDEIVSSFDAAIELASGAVAPTNRKANMPVQNLTAAQQAAANIAAKGDAKKDAHATLNATITSANKHKDQARAALDAASAMTDSPDDDTMDLAKQCVAALNASADESKRAVKAWEGKMSASDEDTDGDAGGDSDDSGDGDDADTAKDDKAKGAAPVTAPAAAGKAAKAAELLAAFHDDKSFCMDQLSAEATMDQAHAAYATLMRERLSAARKQNEKLQKQVAIAEGGQEAIGIDATRETESAAAGASASDIEATAKAEWKANKANCREKYVSEKVYINVRKRELAE